MNQIKITRKEPLEAVIFRLPKEQKQLLEREAAAHEISLAKLMRSISDNVCKQIKTGNITFQSWGR